MPDITGNTCEIITLFPLQVDCNVTNASVIDSNDGSIILKIKGGTAPYTVTWANGQNGQSLNNLSAGTYSATVVDYYGNFTATTECEVDYGSFYLSKFTDCSDPSNFIYLSDRDFDTNNVYSFNEISGCYEFDSEILYTNESYSALTINSEYENGCNECNPPPPSPPAQISMCLSNNKDTQYTFTYSSTDSNGNYVWTSGPMTLNYVTSGGYWQIDPWSFGSAMRLNQSPASSYPYPTGIWTNFGGQTQTPPIRWEMTQYSCQGLPLTLNAQVTDEQCAGDGNGSVILTATNGKPGYLYTIPVNTITGYVSQSFNGIFNNIPPGQYTAIVTDNSTPIPKTTTTTFTIGAGIPIQTYSFSLSQVSLTNTINNTTTTNSVTTTYTYDISINPPLPSGVSMTADLELYHLREISGSQPPSNLPTFSVTHNFLKNNITPISTTDTIPTPSFGNPCGSNPSPQESYTTNANNVTFTSGDYVRITVSQTVDLGDLGDDCSCPTKGMYRTRIYVYPTGINGGNCNDYNTSIVQSNPVDTTRQGCQTGTVPCNAYKLQNNLENPGSPNAVFSYIDCNDNSQSISVSVGVDQYVCARPHPNLTSGDGTWRLISSTCT